MLEAMTCKESTLADAGAQAINGEAAKEREGFGKEPALFTGFKFATTSAPFSFGAASSSASLSFGDSNAAGSKPQATLFGGFGNGGTGSAPAAATSFAAANPFGSLAPDGDEGNIDEHEGKEPQEEPAEPLGREVCLRLQQYHSPTIFPHL